MVSTSVASLFCDYCGGNGHPEKECPHRLHGSEDEDESSDESDGGGGDGDGASDAESDM